MELQRTIFLGLALFLAMLLWNQWQADYSPKPIHQTIITNTANNTELSSSQDNGLALPSVSHSIQHSMVTGNTATAAFDKERIISVNTDVLALSIDSQGGNIVAANLSKYPQSVTDKENKVQLLSPNLEDLYVAQSGLVGNNGPDTVTGAQAIYQTSAKRYILENGQEQLQVRLNWQSVNGIMVEKIFTFARDSYTINVAYRIINHSDKPWVGHVYNVLKRKKPEVEKTLNNFHTFTGAAFSSPVEHYEKIAFDDMAKHDLNQQIQGGWAAMLQHYFISAWVPPANERFHYYTKQLKNDVYVIGMVGPKLSVPANQQLTTSSKLYVGPAVTKRLDAVAPHLKLTVDYGVLWIFSIIIFKAMSTIHSIVGNWGWAIVLVTLFIKILLHPLSAMSYRSMAKMRELQPKMQSLKERYGDDKQRFTKATMELYKTEKINPLGGCLPMLVQIPIFLGLYWVLLDSVEFRQAPFIFWIHDLSIKDPFYVLPVLMGISMFLQQRLTPAPPDPTQAKVMMFMPVFFTALFLNFPAGLVLYWLVNNIVSVLQQWWIMRQFNLRKA